MNKDRNPDRGTNGSDKIQERHKGVRRRSVNKDTSPEDVHESESEPLLSSPSQHRSPDGFPRLLGNDQERGSRPNHASKFWSQLGRRSNGDRKVSDSTARIKEPANPPTEKDTAESVTTSSGDQLHRSKILETNGTSTSSSGVDHQARASGSPVVSGSHVGATDPPARGTRSPARVSYLESHCPSPQKSKETLTPDVGTREQSVEIEAQKRLIFPPSLVPAKNVIYWYTPTLH